MISKIFVNYAREGSNLFDLRVGSICVTAFHAFLQLSELFELRCCDLKFITENVTSLLVELYIVTSKTDIHRDGKKC